METMLVVVLNRVRVEGLEAVRKVAAPFPPLVPSACKPSRRTRWTRPGWRAAEAPAGGRTPGAAESAKRRAQPGALDLLRG